MVVKKRGLLKSTKKKSPVNLAIYRTLCGERGIRTPGTSQYAGFQDRCIRPLCHLSIGCYGWLVAVLVKTKVCYLFAFCGCKGNAFY